MTAPRSTLRPRRTTTVEQLPDALVSWFTYGGSAPWEALIPPFVDLLSERWRTWKTKNPDACPPVGYEWLDDATSPNHPTPAVVAEARRVVARLKL
jgi:hypothetical protein